MAHRLSSAERRWKGLMEGRLKDNAQPEAKDYAVSPFSSHGHHYPWPRIKQEERRDMDQMAQLCLSFSATLPGSNSSPYLDIILVSSLLQPDMHFCLPIISQEVASTFKRIG